MDYYMCFLKDTYPILHVYGVHVYLFMYDVSNVVKEGSRSHLLVGSYMIHHFLPFPI